MGCDWEWGWGGAWDCVSEAAEGAVDWLWDNPDVAAVWAGVAAACAVSWGTACGPAIGSATSYTYAVAREDIKEYAQEEGAKYARRVFYRALEGAYEAIDRLLDAGTITPFEAVRLKEAAAIELEAEICTIPEEVKVEAMWRTREVAMNIYRRHYKTTDLKGLVDRALSEVSYSAPEVRESVSICPSFIQQLRVELARHFARWGAARTRAALPGEPPPIAVADEARRTVAQQVTAVGRMREANRGWANPSNVIASLKKSGLARPTAKQTIRAIGAGQMHTQKGSRPIGEAIIAAALMAAACGAAYWAARR